MGIKNYMIDGVSCAGKTTVCAELQRRGYHAIHGDEVLAYWGNPRTGEEAGSGAAEDRVWMWHLGKVRALLADPSHAVTFLCGGCRNSDDFVALLDGAFVLDIDLETLNRRLASRPQDAWGGTATEGEAFARWQHSTKQGFPKDAVVIDATAPVSTIVETILDRVRTAEG